MGVNFVKQYRQAGLLGKLPLISVSTIDGSTLPALKSLAVGAITSAPYAPNIDNAQNKQFVEAFVKAYNRQPRSEEHTSELQSLMRISYAVFRMKQKKQLHPRKKQIQNHT